MSSQVSNNINIKSFDYNSNRMPELYEIFTIEELYLQDKDRAYDLYRYECIEDGVKIDNFEDFCEKYNSIVGVTEDYLSDESNDKDDIYENISPDLWESYGMSDDRIDCCYDGIKDGLKDFNNGGIYKLIDQEKFPAYAKGYKYGFNYDNQNI